MLLVLSAVPAFVVGAAIVRGLGQMGVSEITSFMISMPLLIVAWFYFIGLARGSLDNKGTAPSRQ
jgi:hypothetical protein